MGLMCELHLTKKRSFAPSLPPNWCHVYKCAFFLGYGGFLFSRLGKQT